tara:strand:+ start:15690 stop:16148 length:459 start_codon:yes stop_codon:yes gene_type:complete
MGINTNTYNTFVDDMAARQEAILIRRNLMGLNSNKKRRRKRNMNASGNSEETPISEIVNKKEVQEGKKHDSKISGLQDELEKLKSQNNVALETSSRKAGSFWQRNKKDVIDAVIVLGVLFIAYKLFFDKKEVAQNEMGGKVASAETGGEVEI